MTLHTDISGSGRDVVLLHGFTQTGRSWRSIAQPLSAGHRVTTVDAPGHGESSEVLLDLPRAADAVADACGGAVYVGYSMGARLALHLAVRHPQLVHGLVLLGATPGILDASERMARRASDVVLAKRIEAIGVPVFIEEWLQNPLFAGLPVDAVDRADRARNTAAGLASSLRLAGTGAQEPLWDRLAELNMPVLVLAGSADHKFTAIGRQMAEAIGDNARFEQIEGAGHSAHLEQPEAFVTVVAAWLRTLPPQP